jgi:hypothetical protein
VILVLENGHGMESGLLSTFLKATRKIYWSISVNMMMIDLIRRKNDTIKRNTKDPYACTSLILRLPCTHRCILTSSKFKQKLEELFL